MKGFAVMLLLSVFNLEECIEYAVQSSPEMVAARIEAEKSRTRLDCSRLEYLPSLNLYLNQYFNWGRSVDMQELQIIRNRLTKQSGASVGTSFTIFDGMRRVNGTAREKELLQSALWNEKAVEMELAEEITRAYLECLLARELKGSLETIHRSSLEKAEIAEALFRDGTVTRSAVMEIRAQLASEEAAIVQACGDEESAKGRLVALMGYNSDRQSFDIETIDTDSFVERESSEVTLSPARAPGIRALEHEMNAQEYSVRMAKGMHLPTVALTGAYGTYYSDISPDRFGNQLRDNVNPSLTLSLSLPIFAGGTVLREISEAECALRESRTRMEKAVLEMENALDAVELECAALLRKVDADRKYMQMCLEKENAAAEEFLEGAIGASEYIDSRKEAIQSSREYICSLYRYLFQQKTIEHYNSYGN